MTTQATVTAANSNELASLLWNVSTSSDLTAPLSRTALAEPPTVYHVSPLAPLASALARRLVQAATAKSRRSIRYRQHRDDLANFTPPLYRLIISSQVFGLPFPECKIYRIDFYSFQRFTRSILAINSAPYG